MENSASIIKAEITFSFKEFKKLIKIYNDRIENYLKNFQDTGEIINDDDMAMFSNLNFEYFNLAKDLETLF